MLTRALFPADRGLLQALARQRLRYPSIDFAAEYASVRGDSAAVRGYKTAALQRALCLEQRR
eukprot:1771770-Rhodomonas_salina.3